MNQNTRPRVTPRQRRMLDAIDAGHTTVRAIGTAAGVASTSVVKYNLERLAGRGLVVLEPCGELTKVYDGRDFCAAWDAAARLAGNPEV